MLSSPLYGRNVIQRFRLEQLYNAYGIQSLMLPLYNCNHHAFMDSKLLELLLKLVYPTITVFAKHGQNLMQLTCKTFLHATRWNLTGVEFSFQSNPAAQY